MPVKTETFGELWAPLFHTNFRGNSHGPIIGPYLFLGKFVWTHAPENSSKVSPYTGIGPWMALPRTGTTEMTKTTGIRVANHGFPKWKSPDLPLPHGLAPSETMVWDHGLNPPPSTENPLFLSGSGAPIFKIWSRRPRAQGVGVDPCLLTKNGFRNTCHFRNFQIKKDKSGWTSPHRKSKQTGG